MSKQQDTAYTDVNYAEILKHAAESLKSEGRYNQAGVLTDAANAFVQLRAQIAAVQALSVEWAYRDDEAALYAKELEAALQRKAEA